MSFQFTDGYIPASRERPHLVFRGRFWLISLPLHPFPDIWRTLQDRDAHSFTFIQESDAVDIDQIDLLQIQDYRLAGPLHLGLHFGEVLRPQLTAYANPR